MFKLGVAALGLLAVFHSESVYAFTLIVSQGTGWQTSTLTLDVDSSCTSYLTTVNDAVSGAISLWNGVSSADLTVSIGTTVTLPNAITTYVGTSPTNVAPAGNPIIVCEPNFAADTGQDSSNIPAFAGAFNIDSSGKMLGALLVLNVESGAAASIQTLGASLVKAILSHEIGHVLGFGHSADPNALMYYQVSQTKPARLALDDVAAISYLYPRQEPSGGAFGCGTISAEGGSGGSGSGGGSAGAVECLGLLGVCILGWLRLRSRVRTV